MTSGLSNGHVTDDVTWTWRSNSWLHTLRAQYPENGWIYRLRYKEPPLEWHYGLSHSPSNISDTV